MIPRATYRLQFHRGFTFADAEALVPYLHALGISHIYASPITTARSGSTHGYDVVDPTRINPELGGEPAFRSLVAALRAHGMGVIVDIVPNHMGVAGGENGWWRDVLEKGQGSAFAPYFDIDWREPLLLPVLGESPEDAMAQGALTVEERDGQFELTAYGEHRFPIRAEDQAALRAGEVVDMAALLHRQHYRLACWRDADSSLNWRRFFTITDLAGLSVEDPAVFEATHALVFRLYAEGLIDGVRIDHIDGLTDPATYCRTLRARLDGIARPADAPPGPAFIVVEKILAAHERLAPDWGVDGTSGYDFMEQVNAVLHDPAGAGPLSDLWARIAGRGCNFAAEELTARQEMLDGAFRGQLRRCAEAFAALAASAAETRHWNAETLGDAIRRLLWVFPVYRTYGDGTSAPDSDAAIRARVCADVEPYLHGEAAQAADMILQWLAGQGPGDPALAAQAVRRFQQLSAPIAAKAVEDTAFYRFGRLLSRNDVGSDAECFAAPVDLFHAQQAQRAARFPHALLATATHDHKRGEDVRARLAVLSAVPQEWRVHVTEWERLAQDRASETDPADRYMLYQTLFGAWPEGDADAASLRRFVERVKAWQEKAVREARLRSSWENPDADYEGRMAALIERLLDPAASPQFVNSMAALVRWAEPAAIANSLAQAALHLTLPGVPDIYQGGELMDLSLVDPDNRRPVDYDRRRDLLNGAAERQPEKLRLVRQLLALRQDDPELFAAGGYAPLECVGARAGNLIAFERSAHGRTLTCAVAIRCGSVLAGGERLTPAADWWGDTAILCRSGPLQTGALFGHWPVHIGVT